MNILLFVSDYPPSGNTSAIHYFAREWVKAGNRVCVIYGCHRLAFPLYLFAGQIDRRTSAGSAEQYELDGVNVIKIPLTRMIPKSRLICSLSKHRAKIQVKQILNKWGKFDVIISHFCSNHLFLVEEAKKANICPVVSVFHTCDTVNDKLAKRILDESSVIGARSAKIEAYLKNTIGYGDRILRINSGVPQEYIINQKTIRSADELKFIYVGKLIKRKNVAEMLEGFAMLPSQVKYHLDIIGDGLEKEALVKKCNELNLNEKVSFLGTMTRDAVAEYMSEADCFVMISSGETFGLVYLEAMAAGCIVIGSKGEGIDGIIVDGDNGFLVSPGNTLELKQKLIYLSSMSHEQRSVIMKKSHATVLNMTDTEVAKRYLDEVKEGIHYIPSDNT